MDDFKEQYRQELINQEIKSNKHTLRGFFCFLLGVALIWLLTAVGFFDVDRKLVTIASASTLILFLPLLAIYMRTDLAKSWIKYFFLAMICIVCGVIVSFLSYHAVLLYVAPLLFAVQYRRKAAIWFVFAVNTVTMLISSLVSFYYGLCDLNLLLESQHVRDWYLNVITDGALNIPFNENPTFIIIVFEVFPRSIILFVFSVMMQYYIVSSNEDAYRIALLTHLKETDRGTKVFNKNKYEEMTAEYYPGIEQIAVMFWDLNDLKHINDQYGHATGDRVIEKLSSVLLGYSDDKCRVYRVGGDEFLMIIDNPGQGEAEDTIADIRKKLEAANRDEAVPISSAVGLAYGRGEEILRVVEKADAQMYQNKKWIKEGRGR